MVTSITMAAASAICTSKLNKNPEWVLICGILFLLFVFLLFVSKDTSKGE